MSSTFKRHVSRPCIFFPFHCLHLVIFKAKTHSVWTSPKRGRESLLSEDQETAIVYCNEIWTKVQRILREITWQDRKYDCDMKHETKTQNEPCYLHINNVLNKCLRSCVSPIMVVDGIWVFFLNIQRFKNDKNTFLFYSCFQVNWDIFIQFVLR